MAAIQALKRPSCRSAILLDHKSERKMDQTKSAGHRFNDVKCRCKLPMVLLAVLLGMLDLTSCWSDELPEGIKKGALKHKEPAELVANCGLTYSRVGYPDTGTWTECDPHANYLNYERNRLNYEKNHPNFWTNALTKEDIYDHVGYKDPAYRDWLTDMQKNWEDKGTVIVRWNKTTGTALGYAAYACAYCIVVKHSAVSRKDLKVNYCGREGVIKKGTDLSVIEELAYTCDGRIGLAIQSEEDIKKIPPCGGNIDPFTKQLREWCRDNVE